MTEIYLNSGPLGEESSRPVLGVRHTVHSSEGTVLIDYQWGTLTAAELAAARRAGRAS
jgi:hypothetical protein